MVGFVGGALDAFSVSLTLLVIAEAAGGAAVVGAGTACVGAVARACSGRVAGAGEERRELVEGVEGLELAAEAEGGFGGVA